MFLISCKTVWTSINYTKQIKKYIILEEINSNCWNYETSLSIRYRSEVRNGKPPDIHALQLGTNGKRKSLA